MLNPADAPPEAVADQPAPVRHPAAAPPAGPAPLRSLLRVAVRIAARVADGNLLYVAADDNRAASLAEMVRALVPEAAVVLVPGTDALPGDDAPASPGNAGQRVAALRRIADLHSGDGSPTMVCITSADATAQLYAPPRAFAGQAPVLVPGDAIDLDGFEDQCLELGYIVDDRIDEPGEVAVRGSVIDIFPADAPDPVRVDVEDGRITAIRRYDAADQRTTEPIDRVEIGRASEPDGADGVTLIAYTGPVALVEEREAASRRRAFLALAQDAARFGRAVRTTADAGRWADDAAQCDRLDWTHDDAGPIARLVEQRSPLAALQRLAAPLLADGGVLVLVGGPRDLRFLRPRIARRMRRDILELEGWSAIADAPPGSIVTLEAPADAGFRDGEQLVVAAADLLGSRAVTGGQGPVAAHQPLGDQADLHVGDVVVHEDHGVALLVGIEPMPGAPEEAGDAIVLEFAGGTRRLVAALESDRVWRYGGEADAVTLDKLDGSSWEKRRADIDAALAETARGLVALAATRDQRRVPVIEPDAALYEQFAGTFPFTETPDQARAIAVVRDDLASGRPMDRLVIGDVGYGKTEVALRAAALVALAGGQVAMAAPTTVLVRQHLSLFQRRFADTGITVAGLSRLSSAAEKKAVKAGLADGSIDIVIGTAAVAGKGVAYHRLGLVVIDEEQRFGAADKARLRGMHDGHVLTLSATPIPRTLQSALVGLQQMSVIATPPARRQPIRTTVDAWDDALVRTALMRERARRGQSFVVVPRIEDMAGIAARLARMFPEGEVIEAHGKMPADALDTAMTEFADGRGDVLLATNIIEAGLDVPRANTMVVWRPDRFGLSQLHQLRGRVGRGNRRGQILLLTDGDTAIAPATLKRLRTLQAFDRLGAGFDISARDLDLRGAGDLLGDSQTGHMRLIGVDLYQHLLGQALRAARGESVDDWQPDLNIGLAAAIPEQWLADTDLRIQTYGRLARLTSAADIDALEEELSDRFGDPPPAVTALLTIARVRVLAHAAGVARIDAGPAAIALTLRENTDPAPWDEAGTVASGERRILKEAIDDPAARAERLVEVLEQVAGS